MIKRFDFQHDDPPGVPILQVGSDESQDRQRALLLDLGFNAIGLDGPTDSNRIDALLDRMHARISEAFVDALDSSYYEILMEK